MRVAPLLPDETRSLLELARQGKIEAINRLLAGHRAYIRRVVELRMDGRLAARLDPSDVVQEAMLEATHRLPVYLETNPLPFHLWLRQVSCDRLRDLERKHLGAERRAVGREVHLSPHSSIVLAQQLRAADDGPLQRVIDAELVARVHEALASLPEQDAEIILLRSLEELSNQEAATVLGLQPAATSKRYTRALLRLGTALKERLQEPRS